MKKLLGNLYIGLGLAVILILIIWAYKVILFLVGILAGILMINKGLQMIGSPTMQDRVKKTVMQRMNPFKFY
jgi:hypothetical protein